MASKKLLEMLNEALANEVLVSIQYMWHHVTVRGINAEEVGGVFKRIAMAEMKHAEAIAERLDYLGGILTTRPLKTTICLGKSAKQMLEMDRKAEEEAIALYRQIIKVAEKEGDHTTKRLFEEILSAEEDHHNTFCTLSQG